jgi:hypothetical protein
MDRARRLFASIAAATLLVGAAGLTAPPAWTQPRCPDVEAIAIPGTTETTTGANPTTPVGMLANVLQPLAKRADHHVTTFYTPYPASITDGGYQVSKQAGIRAANTELAATARRCPAATFLLTGYSQGADAAGDIAAAIGHGTGAIPANKLLAVGLLADPAQSPAGQPTIGPTSPPTGFTGIRADGFGDLTARGGILSICAPQDFFCNLPQNNLVMRMIGSLGSHLDTTDPAGSAQQLATIFMAALIAPAMTATTEILQLLRQPGLIPNLINHGAAFITALTTQLAWLAGPQIAAPATTLVATAHNTVNAIRALRWPDLPALITQLSTQATTLASTLTNLHDQTRTINTTAFNDVGNSALQIQNAVTHNNPTSATVQRAGNALLAAVHTAAGNTPQATAFTPTWSQFTLTNVIAGFTAFANFIAGAYHTNYNTATLDRAGHTGTQILTKYFSNQLDRRY